jgi:hypothetical protein
MLNSESTLVNVFERIVLKERVGLSAERAQDYRRHIDRFNTRMVYSGVVSITNLTLLEFRESLQSETKADGTPALSNLSVNGRMTVTLFPATVIVGINQR